MGELLLYLGTILYGTKLGSRFLCWSKTEEQDALSQRSNQDRSYASMRSRHSNVPVHQSPPIKPAFGFSALLAIKRSFGNSLRSNSLSFYLLLAPLLDGLKWERRGEGHAALRKARPAQTMFFSDRSILRYEPQLSENSSFISFA